MTMRAPPIRSRATFSDASSRTSAAIGFGKNELGRRLASAPHIRARIGQIKRELDRLVLDALEETARHLALPRSDHDRLGRAYLESVERLGFGP